MFGSNRGCHIIQCLEDSLSRSPLAEDWFQYFCFQVWNHPGELLHSLSSPAIGADD